MFNFIRMFLFLVVLIGGVCGFMALMGQGASEGLALLDSFDPTDFSAVGTRSTAVPAAAPAALEPPQAEAAPTEALAAQAEVAAPAEAVPVEAVTVVEPNGQGVLAVGIDELDDFGRRRVTYFRYEADEAAQAYQIPEGTYLKLEFELEGKDGWYGVTWLGYQGYVRMAEIDLPDGLYTWDDLDVLLPRRAGW